MKKIIIKLKKICCALWGHSKIQHTFFGYWYCCRCEAQVGDSLGGVYSAENIVILNHNCKKCVENYKKLSWKDKFLVPYPFGEKK